MLTKYHDLQQQQPYSLFSPILMDLSTIETELGLGGVAQKELVLEADFTILMCLVDRIIDKYIGK